MNRTILFITGCNIWNIVIHLFTLKKKTQIYTWVVRSFWMMFSKLPIYRMLRNFVHRAIIYKVYFERFYCRTRTIKQLDLKLPAYRYSWKLKLHLGNWWCSHSLIWIPTFYKSSSTFTFMLLDRTDYATVFFSSCALKCDI